MTTATVSCPCCGNALTVKADKRGHPYLSCAPCGFAGLVHRREGVEAFTKRYGWSADGAPAAPAAVAGTEPAPAVKGGGHRARRQA
jgi:hypothetical protein